MPFTSAGPPGLLFGRTNQRRIDGAQLVCHCTDALRDGVPARDLLARDGIRVVSPAQAEITSILPRFSHSDSDDQAVAALNDAPGCGRCGCQCQAIRIARKSFTLVRVGPVRISAPIPSNRP